MSTGFSQNEHDSNKQRINPFEDYDGSYDFSYGESNNRNLLINHLKKTFI